VQAVPWPTEETVAAAATSPLITLIKDGKVDLVINAAPPGKSSKPCECRRPACG
jgi:hypothetical protein